MPTTALDVMHILDHGLRQCDIDELEAMGSEPREALLDAVEKSGVCCMTIHSHGRAAGIFGAVYMGDDLGSPWMLGTDLLKDIPFELVLQGRPWVDWIARIYPKLVNFVDERNETTILWLEAMGFTFDGAGFTATHHDTVFRRFSRCASQSP